MFERVLNYRDIFDYIVEYKRNNDGNSPSIREIMKACRLSSTSVTNYILNHLEAEGLILLPERGISRGIRVIGGKWSF